MARHTESLTVRPQFRRNAIKEAVNHLTTLLRNLSSSTPVTRRFPKSEFQMTAKSVGPRNKSFSLKTATYGTDHFRKIGFLYSFHQHLQALNDSIVHSLAGAQCTPAMTRYREA